MPVANSPDNPLRRALPQHSRHLARHLLRLGRSGRGLPASVVETQLRALEYDVTRTAGSRKRPSARSQVNLGYRVRLGVEGRDLLRRLLASKDLQVQQALVREIAVLLRRRIAASVRRRDARLAAGALTSRLAGWIPAQAARVRRVRRLRPVNAVDGPEVRARVPREDRRVYRVWSRDEDQTRYRKFRRNRTAR